MSLVPEVCRGPIVMVDDNDIDLLLARRCCTAAGLDAVFVTFSSGAEFIDHLDKVRTGSEAMPSVVLLDINMPGLDGFAVLSTMRATTEFSEQPQVTMLTHSENPRDKEKSLALGASDYFTKPDDISRYIEFFESLCLH